MNLTERTMVFKPELQIREMNHVGFEIKVWRAKQDKKIYFVKQGGKNIMSYNQWYNAIMVEWGPESNPVISTVGAYAEYVSEDYLSL